MRRVLFGECSALDGIQQCLPYTLQAADLPVSLLRSAAVGVLAAADINEDSCLLQGRTRLLVTHQRQFLPACDRVVVLRGGRVFADGAYANLAPLNLPELAGSEGAMASLDDAAYDAEGVGAGGHPPTDSTADLTPLSSAATSTPASEAGGEADPDPSKARTLPPLPERPADAAAPDSASRSGGATQASAGRGSGAGQRQPRMRVQVPTSVFDAPAEPSVPVTLGLGGTGDPRASEPPHEPAQASAGDAGHAPAQGGANPKPGQHFRVSTLDSAKLSSALPSGNTSDDAGSSLKGQDSGISRAARRMRQELSSCALCLRSQTSPRPTGETFT